MYEDTSPIASGSLPRLNEPAPEFTAETTHGPLSLASLRGRWVVLFSHPADFTPVCPTELGFTAKLGGETTKAAGHAEDDAVAEKLKDLGGKLSKAA